MTEENKRIDEAPKGAAAPKAGAGKADALQKAGDWEDLGPAVVEPTDKNPDAAKKQKKDKSAPTKGAPSPESQEKVKESKSKDEDEKKEQDDVEKKNEDEDDVEEAKVTESRPKTKSGMIQAMYDKLNLMKKADISAKFDKIVAQFGDDDEGEDEKDDDEKDVEAAAAVEKKEAVEKRVKDIDVKDDVEALVKGDSSLSDEFKQKAATIFEAAVKSKVKAEIERLEGEYATELTESKKEVKDLLVTKVDNYLNYVVEEWMKDNELAIEKGIKGEIAEDFIGGLKQLFEDHYIDVPDEKYDILDAKEKEIDELKSKVNEMTEKAVDDKKQIDDYSKEDILEHVTSGLADTEKEKMKSLVEDISFEGADEYKKKLSTIKESYFGTGKSAPESTENVDSVNTDNGSTVDVSGSMKRYTDAISRAKSRDIYNK
jgi:hypothetical protein